MTEINQLELSIRELVREMTKQKMTKRVPDIPAIDTRRLAFCLIEDRMALYKEAEKKVSLDKVLIEFGITSRQTYYNWYEKYHPSYQAM